MLFKRFEVCVLFCLGSIYLLHPIIHENTEVIRMTTKDERRENSEKKLKVLGT